MKLLILISLLITTICNAQYKKIDVESNYGKRLLKTKLFKNEKGWKKIRLSKDDANVISSISFVPKNPIKDYRTAQDIIIKYMLIDIKFSRIKKSMIAVIYGQADNTRKPISRKIQCITCRFVNINDERVSEIIVFFSNDFWKN